MVMDDFKDFLAEFVLPMLALMLGFFALVGLAFVAVTRIERQYVASQCVTFAEQSGYQTKFVDYSFLSYDCLALTENGKWIPTDQLRGVNQ